MLTWIKMIISYLREIFSTIKQYLILKGLTDDDKIVQILTLTKEVQDLKLQIQKQNIPKPQASIAYKQLWTFLVKYEQFRVYSIIDIILPYFSYFDAVFLE